MEDIYKFEVDNDEFLKVLNGKKTVQLVINDNKHKVYAVGNQITFTRNIDGLNVEELEKDENGEPKIKQTAIVENLLYFEDIKEAIETLGKENCGFKPSATFEKASDLFIAGESLKQLKRTELWQ